MKLSIPRSGSLSSLASPKPLFKAAAMPTVSRPLMSASSLTSPVSPVQRITQGMPWEEFANEFGNVNSPVMNKIVSTQASTFKPAVSSPAIASAANQLQSIKPALPQPMPQLGSKPNLTVNTGIGAQGFRNAANVAPKPPAEITSPPQTGGPISPDTIVPDGPIPKRYGNLANKAMKEMGIPKQRREYILNISNQAMEVAQTGMGIASLAKQPEKGDKGDKGDAGEAGKDGSAGRDGAQGAAGRDGRDGAPGAAGRDGEDGRPGSDAIYPQNNYIPSYPTYYTGRGYVG